MTDSTSDRDAEHLLDAVARGDAPATDPLAALLTAATLPNHNRALAGEEAALAEFRAAQQPPATPTKRTGHSHNQTPPPHSALPPVPCRDR